MQLKRIFFHASMGPRVKRPAGQLLLASECVAAEAGPGLALESDIGGCSRKPITLQPRIDDTHPKRVRTPDAGASLRGNTGWVRSGHHAVDDGSQRQRSAAPSHHRRSDARIERTVDERRRVARAPQCDRRESGPGWAWRSYLVDVWPTSLDGGARPG